MDPRQYMLDHGHEQVVHIADAHVGLRAVIAIHSSALGPALGGVRFWRYDRVDDAVLDVLRLSEAMSYKAACAQLPQGGGKAVCIVDDPDAARPEELLHALGRAIDELGGRYIAAEDVGATTRDMDLIATQTPWVTGVSESLGGSGDPSPVTAVGVVAAMRAARERLEGVADLAGWRVAVQGAGHVGSHAVRRLVEAGAAVVVADVDATRAASVAEATGARLGDASSILSEECDVLAPCALGGVLDEATIGALRCRVVCGAANNQLATDADDARLAGRGIVYVPDFVANAGGIINLAREYLGGTPADAVARAEGIAATVVEVLELAEGLGVPPGAAAVSLARRRIAAGALAGGRFEPGAATAWTNGAPLTSLR